MAAAAPDFVDDVEDGKARVLAPDGAARTIAVADLPPGAVEGASIAGGQVVPSPPDTGAAIRQSLGAGDPGGTIDLSAQPGVDAVSGGTAIPPVGAPAPGSPDAFIDQTIAAPPIGQPAAPVPPPIPKPGPGGLPADSQDLQQRALQANDEEKKAVEGVGEAKADAADKVAEAQKQRDDLRWRQQADEAAEREYVRTRQQALDDEDARNLQKARDTVIPDFWESKEGQLAGAAITVGLAGFFGGALAGATGGKIQNPAADAIQHNIDAYYTQQKQKIDNLYRYAEQKGMLDEKTKARYASELTDLMQQHAYTLQAASDRIGEVAEQGKGLVDQAQAKVAIAQLSGQATQQLQQARKLDVDIYDAETKRKVAEADQLRAQAAMAKAHKGGGSGAFSKFVEAAGQLKPGDPIPPELAVLGRQAGLKPNQVAAEIDKYRGSGAKAEKLAGAAGLGEDRQLTKQVDQWRKENGIDDIAKKQREIGAVLDEVQNAPHNPLQQALAIEKAVSSARGGAASRQALDLALHHLGGRWANVEAFIQGAKTGEVGAKQMDNFIGFMDNQLGTAQKEGKSAYDNFDKYIASQPPEKKAGLEAQRGRIFSGLHGFGGGGGGGAGAPAAASGPVEGATSVSAKGIPIVFRGGKWQKQ